MRLKTENHLHLFKNNDPVEKEKVAVLARMFGDWCGQEPQQISFLPQSGSYRSYCRMQSGTFSALGAWNADARENDLRVPVQFHGMLPFLMLLFCQTLWIDTLEGHFATGRLKR